MNFTPLSIGITETMIYIGTKSIEIKISEIILVVFRLSLLIIYFIFGMLSIFLLQKKIKMTKCNYCLMDETPVILI